MDAELHGHDALDCQRRWRSITMFALNLSCRDANWRIRAAKAADGSIGRKVISSGSFIDFFLATDEHGATRYNNYWSKSRTLNGVPATRT